MNEQKTKKEKKYPREPQPFSVKKVEELGKTTEALLNMLEDVEGSRERAEEERDRTLAIITSFTDGLLVFDYANNLTLINPQAESFLRTERKKIVGKSVLELTQVPEFEALINLLGREIRTVFRKELELRDKLVVEVSTIPLVREEKSLGKILILHDITRERAIEKMKTEFVSIAAHQLRTPLSAIKWTLRMLLDGDLGSITESQKEFIEKTYKSNERMISLINDLLNVTRIEEGRYLYKPILTNIEPILEFVVRSYKEVAETKNLKLDFRKPIRKVPMIMADVEKIRLAIQNILDNSMRYTRSGGWVTVSLEHDKKEHKIKISVKDSGVGIPKDQQERVFAKFFRGANVMRMETEGSGLGLFITKNIIEAHGGKIWFESETGKGTTFYITLPVKKEFERFIEGF